MPTRCARSSLRRVPPTHSRSIDCRRRPKPSACCTRLCGGRTPMLTDRCIWRFAREGLVLLPLLAGCSSDPITLAPASPETPWRIPPQSEAATSLTGPTGAVSGTKSDAGQSSTMTTSGAPNVGQTQRPATAPEEKLTVERNRDYDLVALIDLAQRSNPQTREAWERARQAALAVGLVQSAYVPQLSAEALPG